MYNGVAARRWRAFDQATINREMAELPRDDRRPLQFAMSNYRDDLGIHYRVENYGEGLMMVTDSSLGQGRCLFFSVQKEGGGEMLTALLVYKKESQKVPKRVLDLARKRMRDSS